MFVYKQLYWAVASKHMFLLNMRTVENILILLHSEQPKLNRVLAILCAIGLACISMQSDFGFWVFILCPHLHTMSAQSVKPYSIKKADNTIYVCKI